MKRSTRSKSVACRSAGENNNDNHDRECFRSFFIHSVYLIVLIIFFFFFKGCLNPMKRSTRSKSVQYGKRVRIAKEPEPEIDIVLRRSTRISVPVKKFNYGSVKCCVCHKTFHEDIAFDLYNGNIICSFECFKKANNN